VSSPPSLRWAYWSIVWRVRGKIFRSVLCTALCATVAHNNVQQLCTVQCTHMNGLNSRLLVRCSFSVVMLCYSLLWPPFVADADIFLPCGFLWSPCVIEQTIIFLPCDFFLSSSFFLSSPNLSGRRLDVYHTSTYGVALVRM